VLVGWILFWIWLSLEIMNWKSCVVQFFYAYSSALTSCFWISLISTVLWWHAPLSWVYCENSLIIYLIFEVWFLLPLNIFVPLGMDYLDSRRKSRCAGKIIAAALCITVCIIILKQNQSPTYSSLSLVSYSLDIWNPCTYNLCLLSMWIL